MPRIITYLSDDVMQDLKKISKSSGESVSKISAELIEIGHKIKYLQEPQELNLLDKKSDLADTYMEYFLRILNINSEILRKLYDEPSKFTSKTAESILAEIKDRTKKLVKDKLNNK